MFEIPGGGILLIRKKFTEHLLVTLQQIEIELRITPFIVVVENAQQRIVPDQLRRPRRKSFVAARQRFFQLSGDQMGLETASTDRLEALCHPFRFLRQNAVDEIGRIADSGKSGVEIAVSAVVAPHRKEQFFHLQLAAGGDAGLNRTTRLIVIVPETTPGPDAGAHQGLVAEVAVTLNHLLVHLGFFVVVIPVDQLYVPRNLLLNLRRNRMREIVIVPLRIAEPEIHIRPDHRLESVFAAKLIHPPEMAVEKLEPALIAEQVEKAAAPKVMGLIHADVNAARTEIFAPETNHLADQGIGFRFVDQKHLAGVLDFAVGAVPFENLSQMPERLNAADQLNSESRRIGIQLPDLIGSITAAHISEKRLIRQLIGILGIEHDHVISGERKPAEPHLQVVRPHDQIAGSIQHDPQRAERSCFLAFHSGEHSPDAARGRYGVVFHQRLPRSAGHPGKRLLRLHPAEFQLQPPTEIGDRILLAQNGQHLVKFFRHVIGAPHQLGKSAHTKSFSFR